MPERKISGEMTDQGLGIEQPADDTATNQAQGQGKAKPPTEWTQEDFLAAGIRVTRSEAKVRVTNTATSVTGTRGTGFRIGVDWNKGFKFAK